MQAPCRSDDSISSSLQPPICTVQAGQQQSSQWPPSINDYRANRVCSCGPGLALTAGGSCGNLDACTETPCHPDADCLDYPPPRAGGLDGRSCVCQTGFRGDGEICLAEGNGVAGSTGTGTSETDSAAGSSGGVVAIGVVIILLLVGGIAAVLYTQRTKGESVKLGGGSQFDGAPRLTHQNAAYSPPSSSGPPQTAPNAFNPPRPGAKKPGSSGYLDVSASPVAGSNSLDFTGFGSNAQYGEVGELAYETVDPAEVRKHPVGFLPPSSGCVWSGPTWSIYRNALIHTRWLRICLRHLTKADVPQACVNHGYENADA